MAEVLAARQACSVGGGGGVPHARQLRAALLLVSGLLTRRAAGTRTMDRATIGVAHNRGPVQRGAGARRTGSRQHGHHLQGGWLAWPPGLVLQFAAGAALQHTRKLKAVN